MAWCNYQSSPAIWQSSSNSLSTFCNFLLKQLHTFFVLLSSLLLKPAIYYHTCLCSGYNRTCVPCYSATKPSQQTFLHIEQIRIMNVCHVVKLYKLPMQQICGHFDYIVAWEYSCLSFTPATMCETRRHTSVIHRQKFHTDDVNLPGLKWHN